MRDKLENVRAMRDDYYKEARTTEDYEYGASLDTAVAALDKAIALLEGSIDWCGVCEAPQMIEPDGYHSCSSL